ncbi:MAG TPA: dihydrolipoyl dehydrogenase [Candidatus Binatia bacterium]|nr:dihydrolipoyl dehydrogenase [Candidatus Binatia bacterium]
MAGAGRYDLVVIGAGPGGYVAAIRAAQLGLRVACVEKDPALGGTCLRIGCIPSKALLDSSELYWQARERFGIHGIGVQGLSLDVGALMARKDKVVRGLAQGVASLFRKNGVDHLRGPARLIAPHRVAVDAPESREVETARVLLATGSEPVPLPGLEIDGTHVVTSEEGLAFEAVPERLLVIGAGAIGLELGSVWARLGSAVRVVEILDRIVPGMDADLARALQRALERQGLAFSLGAAAGKAAIEDGRVSVTIEQGGASSTEVFDRVLVAVGRRPYTRGLGLETLGVALDGKGRIQVDEHYQTSVPGIFAVGDVIAGPMLAHKAEDEGIACVERMAGQPGHVNYDAIPNVVYTWPELAGVGKTEEECRAAGRAVKIGTFPFLANGRARAAEEREGLVKVVADAGTDRLLGVHILGPRASDLIAEAVVAIEFGASAEDLARTCHAHPTFSEAVREAALAVAGRSIHQ